MQKPTIVLYSIAEPCLVIEFPSGVLYTNQVGGNVCMQPTQEGVLAPLDLRTSVIEGLESMSIPSGGIGISSEVADRIDALLEAEVASNFIAVDRSRVHESCEAWVYVLVRDVPAERGLESNQAYCGEIFGFAGMRAVLTWQNSD